MHTPIIAAPSSDKRKLQVLCLSRDINKLEGACILLIILLKATTATYYKIRPVAEHIRQNCLKIEH
jgi:hypothetical protein